MFQSAIAELELYRFAKPNRPESVLCEPSLCVIAQGAKEASLAGRSYRYDPARFLLVAVGLPLTSAVVKASPREPCLIVRIKFDLSVVTSILAETGTVAPIAQPSRGLEVGKSQPELIDAVTRLVSLLDTPRDIAPLAALTLREITYRTMMTPQGAVLCQSAMMGMPTHRIAKAIKFIAQRFAEPIRMEALAEQVGMSESAFYSQFKKVAGYSPLNFQKHLRLQEARQVMIRDGLDASEAAFRVGYESPSQFGREYKRLFGRSPRQDIQTA